MFNPKQFVYDNLTTWHWMKPIYYDNLFLFVQHFVQYFVKHYEISVVSLTNKHCQI